MDITFRSLVEHEPSHAARAVFKTGWPGWQTWLQSRTRPDAPTLEESERALALHMPTMHRIWKTFVSEVGADAEAAEFLTFWSPPRFLGACSQAAIGGDRPALVRNYDLDPRLSEATVLLTHHEGRAVLGMVDGIIGLSDGINDAGLAISLAYGGGGPVGRGFGVPMVVRHLLQTCDDVPAALDALRALPHHMPYNLTLVDRAGRTATAFIGPDREMRLAEQPIATNHQERVVDPTHATFTRSEERLSALATAMQRPALAADTLVETFLAAPIAANKFTQGFGTVYTAQYDPVASGVSLHWPGREPWSLTINVFEEREVTIHYPVAAPSPGEDDWLNYVPAAFRQFIQKWATTGQHEPAP